MSWKENWLANFNFILQSVGLYTYKQYEKKINIYSLVIILWLVERVF